MGPTGVATRSPPPAPDLNAEKLRSLDFEPLPTTPAELATYMKADSARWQEAVKLSGFKPNE